MQKIYLVLISVLTLISIVGCSGGGGGGSTPAATTDPNTTFPINAAGNTQTANGSSKNFTITQTGTTSCSGSGTVTSTPANTSVTFALTPTTNVSALSSTSTLVWTWTNCTPVNNAQTTTHYYNPSTYVSYGSVGTSFYNVYLTPPVVPTTIKINDTGIIGTINLYTNSTETVANGTEQVSYTVAADTTTTAIITTIYTISGSTSNSTEIAKSRISTSGTITPISDTISWTSGAAAGITWTLTYQ